MQCPKCEAKLTEKTVAGIAVDQCEECSGIWFDLGEMEDLLGAENIESLKNRTAYNPAHDVVEAPCPKCGGAGKMIPVKNVPHQIHIDSCTVCSGHWLDGGEMEILREKNLLENLGDFFRQLVKD